MADQQMSVPSGETNYLLPITINSSGNRSFTLKTVNKFLDKNIDVTTTTDQGTIDYTLTSLPSGKTSSGTIGRGNYIKITKGYHDTETYYQAQTNNSGTLTITTSKDAQTNISSDGYAYVKVEGINVPVDKTFVLTATSDSALDNTSNISITNGAYRRLVITNVANGTVALTNRGSTTVTSYSNSAGNLTVAAYPSSGSTLDGEKTIVSGGKWVCTPTFNGAGTYYGKVVVGSVNASLGGSTTTTGKATAAIAATSYTANGTSNLNCTTTTPSGTAGQDYWQVKATASITTTPKFTPSLTLTTAGWMSTAPSGTATNVTVNGDTTGASIYIPKASFSVDGNVVFCNSAGYVPEGASDSGVGTIGTGTITPNASLPSGTSAESTVINRGGYIKIGSGYYASDIYYQAQANSGTLTLNSTDHSAQTNISCDGKANVKVTGIKVPSGQEFSLVMLQGSSGNETSTSSDLLLTNNKYRRVTVDNNRGNIYIEHDNSGEGNIFISAYGENTQQQVINNGAWVTTNANTAGAGTYYGKVTLTQGTMSAVTSEPTDVTYNKPNITIASGGWLKMTAGYYPATTISLATLVPDVANIPYSTSSPFILSGKTAYDVNGALITGGIGTYTGIYEETTPGGS